MKKDKYLLDVDTLLSGVYGGIVAVIIKNGVIECLHLKYGLSKDDLEEEIEGIYHQLTYEGNYLYYESS